MIKLRDGSFVAGRTITAIMVLPCILGEIGPRAVVHAGPYVINVSEFGTLDEAKEYAAELHENIKQEAPPNGTETAESNYN